MNKYLLDLAYSFQKVNIDNYQWKALNKNNDYYFQEAENNFSSEIVRHLRNLMDEQSNSPYYREKGLRCHFDVRKERVRICPDIVLHESPDNKEQQEFLVEVKITDIALIKDLKKLKTAISKSLNFKNAVMIVANKPYSKTILEINEFIRSEGLSDDKLEKLHLYHAIKNNDGKTLNYSFLNFKNISNRINE